MEPESRVRVPYTPVLRRAGEREGDVTEITSKGTAIQGTFGPEVVRRLEADHEFETEIPTFADTDALAALLRRTR